MTQEKWTAVDRWLDESLIGEDTVLSEALRDSEAAGLPPYAVAPNQGKLLSLLIQAQRAERVLEIGTLGAYSTIWMARALPAGGRVVTLESDARHAEVARENLRRAGLSESVMVVEGEALATLPQVAKLMGSPFDFVFIDADKEHNADYFAWALTLCRVGATIVVDNVVRGGAVLDATSEDPSVTGVRRLIAYVASEKRVSCAALQTVGSKGYDGLLIAVVVA